MEWLIVLATVGAVLLLAVYALTGASERAESRQSLARIDGYQVEGAARHAHSRLLDRAIEPVKERLTETARKYTPAGYADKVQRQARCSRARRSDVDVDQFLLFKLLGAVSGPLWVLARVRLPRDERGTGVICDRAAVGLSRSCSPTSLVARRIEARQRRDPRAAPRVPRPAHDLGRGRPRLRPGGRADERLGSRAL